MAISFLLHGLLLWPKAGLHSNGDIARPLVATLRTPTAGELAPQAPLPAKPSVPMREHRAPPLRPAVPVVAMTAAPLGKTISSTAETPTRSEAAAPHAAPTVDDGLDADGVRQYRMALATQARRYKRYPAHALEANVGGTVDIRVVVAAGGLPQEILLARSSGHELLDAAALDMMKKAAPGAAVPEALRRRAFAVNLPVVFDPAGE